MDEVYIQEPRGAHAAGRPRRPAPALAGRASSRPAELAESSPPALHACVMDVSIIWQ